MATEWTPEQKEQIAAWVAEGLSLSEIQEKIRETFGVSLTFMEVRMLLLDLNLQVQDKPEKEKAAPEAIPLDAAEATGAAAGAGKVSVTLDRVMQPGSLISGTVTFSDGVTATWSLDSMGRLALAAEQPGYSPSPDDLQQFQAELRSLIESHGF